MTFALFLLLAQAQSMNAFEQHARAGECSAAAALLQKEPKAGEVPYVLLGECYSRLGKTDLAVKTLQDGLRAIPGSGVLLRALGRIRFRQDPESNEVGSLLRRAAAALPRDPEALHYYAQWAYLNNRERLCTQLERRALMLPALPEQALLQMNTLLGMCASRLDDVQTAGAAFKNAFKINQSLQVFDPGSAYQYVQFLLQSRLNTEAQSLVAELLKRSPRFGPAHLEMAKSFDHSGQPAQATEEAQLALAGEGNTPSSIRAAHVLLAKCYFLLGKRSEAEEEQRWIESNPAFPNKGTSLGPR